MLLVVQELKVEVYHTCTRSEAAASKLASGASAAQAATPQDTLLGTAAAPLTDVLTKPQACSHCHYGKMLIVQYIGRVKPFVDFCEPVYCWPYPLPCMAGTQSKWQIIGGTKRYDDSCR